MKTSGLNKLEIYLSNMSLSTLYRLMSVITATLHMTMLLLFLSLGIIPLAILNVFSTTMYFFIFVYVKKIPYYVTNFLAIIEVNAHAILCVYFIGVESKFSLYCLCLIPIVFLGTFKNKIIPFLYSIFCFVCFIGASYISSYFGAKVNISHNLNLALSIMNSAFVFGIFIAFSFFFATSTKISESRTKIINSLGKNPDYTDEVTGLTNKDGSTYLLQCADYKYYTYNEPYTIIMAKCPELYNILKNNGEKYSSFIIKQIADVLTSTLRKDDYIFRWSDDQFLILLQNTHSTGGAKLVSKLKAAMSETVFQYKYERIELTLKFGVAGSHQGDSVKEIIEIASRNTSKAKMLFNM